MTTPVPVIVRLPLPARDRGDAAVTALREALRAAVDHGVEAVLIPHSDAPAPDPTVLAGLLTAEAPGVPILVEAHTGRHAPFNLARRVQTLARITGGLAGVYLRDSGVDPVTSAARPDTASATAVLGEYVRVLRRLWDSFPEAALLGDRDAGLFADVDRIVPARHRGDVYGVEGALNVPIAPEERPVLLADAESLDADAPVDALVVRDGAVDGRVAVYRPLTWIAADGDGPGRLAGGDAVDGAGVLLRVEGPAADFVAHLDSALRALEDRALEDGAPSTAAQTGRPRRGSGGRRPSPPPDAAPRPPHPDRPPARTPTPTGRRTAND